MTTYTHEGIVFDLTVPYADVTGVEWMWTGAWENGEPLMRQMSGRYDCRTPLPLPTLYRDHGPLLPIHTRLTDDQYRAAVDPDYADTVAAGYVETPAEFGARIAKPAVITPANTSAFIKALRRIR